MQPSHNAPEGTHGATARFIAAIDSDPDLRVAVRTYAGDCLSRNPRITTQTLGMNVKTRVFSWALGGGWGYDDPPRFQRALSSVSEDDYRHVDEIPVGDFARHTARQQA